MKNPATKLNPRNQALKRSSSTPLSVSVMPRRGRAAVTDADMWGSTGRMVHRKVENDEGSTTDAAVKAIIEQLGADRTALAQLHGAIQAVARVVNSHSEHMSTFDGRLEEQVRMRLDDRRLHTATVAHIRTGVEDLGRESIRLAEYADTQDKKVYDDLELKLQGILPILNAVQQSR